LTPFRILLLLALPVYFLTLGANSIWDANEAFYVETPRQMVLSGDYVNPTFNEFPRQNKPVLNYWIVAAFYHAFGVSVAVERLAIALGALGIIFATYLIGRALSGPLTGVLAALMMATAPRAVFFSRRIFIDVYITLFMALTLACFVLALRASGARRRWLLVGMYVAIGLGFLTKGPIAVVLPVLVCVLWLLPGRWRELRSLMVVPGALIVLAIAVPWWALLYAEHGWDPIYRFFVGENIGRYRSAMTTAREAWFFLPVLFFDILLPWAPLLLVPIVTAWRRTDGDDAGRAIRHVIWWWIVAITLFFSFAASKEDLYIYPVMPAAAALIGNAVVTSGFGDRDAAVRTLLITVAIACVVLAGAVWWLFRDGYYALDGASAIAVLLAITGSTGAGLALSRQGRAAVMALAAGFVLFNYVFVIRTVPGLERLKPVPPLAATFTAKASPEARLAFCNMDLPSFVYYADRHVTPLDCLSSLAHPIEFLSMYRDVWIITSDKEWAELRSRVPNLCVADRRPLFDIRVDNVLARRPPQDVVLMTSQCSGSVASR
jgi:4-amino-4-deoxy-L-arabinose transferase-like glycosyltransferase